LTTNLYKEIHILLINNKEEDAKRLAIESGLSDKDWEKILTDHFWDWYTEH
jgi:hypothetical protein